MCDTGAKGSTHHEAGIDLKFDNAKFHLEGMAKALQPPERFWGQALNCTGGKRYLDLIWKLRRLPLSSQTAVPDGASSARPYRLNPALSPRVRCCRDRVSNPLL